MALTIKNDTYGNPLNNSNGLIIDYAEDLLSFCEFDMNTFEPLFISHYPINEAEAHTAFLSAINYFQFSKKNYSTVCINYFTEQFTLCPTQFFNESDKKTLLEFNCGGVENKIVLTSDISSDVKLIYSISETLKSLFDQTFPNHHIKHSLCVLSQLMMNSKDLLSEDVLLTIHESRIEFVVKNNHQLLIANQFSVKTEQDVLYYLLFLLEQYQLAPSTVNVCLIGNINSTSEVYVMLKKYVKHIRFASGHKNLIYSEIEGAPQHYNYTLLNRLFCE
jgi:hypothetical protein